MPVSDFSIAVLMGDVQDEELTAMGTRPVKEVNDTNVTAPDKGKTTDQLTIYVLDKTLKVFHPFAIYFSGKEICFVTQC